MPASPLKIKFGATSSQCDGIADNGDPATPRQSYSGPFPQSCQDAPATAKTGPNCVNRGSAQFIDGITTAGLGPNPKATALALANGVFTGSFTLSAGIFTKVWSWLTGTPLTRNVSVSLELSATASLNSGYANIEVSAQITGANGVLAQLRHNYVVSVDATNVRIISVTKDGGAGAWMQFPNGGGSGFGETVATAVIALGPGAYSYSTSLKIDSHADGFADVSAESHATMNY